MMHRDTLGGADHTKDSAGPSFLSSGMVTLGGQVAKMVIQFVGVILLARLLEPEAFGLMATALVVVGVGDLLRDLGVLHAALRTPSLSAAAHSGIFWFSTAVGLTFSGALLLFSGPVASMFSSPDLQLFLLVLSPYFLLNSLQSPYQLLLARRGKFGVLALTEALGQFVGLLIGIFIALNGGEGLALVVQMLAASAVSLVTRAVQSRWVPRFELAPAELLGVLRMGVAVSGNQVLTYASSSAPTLFLGLMYSSTVTGLYNRAYQIVGAPLVQLVSPLSIVVLPRLARIPLLAERFLALRYLQVALAVPTLVATAVSLGMPEVIVRMLLGPGWSGADDFLPPVVIACLFQMLGNVSYWAIVVGGRAGRLLASGIVLKPTIVFCVGAGATVSPEGAAWGFAGGHLLNWVVVLFWIRRDNLISSQHVRESGWLGLVAVGCIPLTFIETSDFNGWALFGFAACVALIVGVAVMSGTSVGRSALRRMIHLARTGRSEAPK